MYIYSVRCIIFIAIRCNSRGLDLDTIIGMQFRLDVVHQIQDFKHDLD